MNACLPFDYSHDTNDCVTVLPVTRLMALGLLAERGPMHGHRIRREAEEKNVESWGGVSIGALYRELHHMEDEGLIEALRNEQVGRRPARTVYQITPEGRRELDILRERAMGEVHRHTDPIGVALLFGGLGEPTEAREYLLLRRRSIDNLVHALRTERQLLAARGCLDATGFAVFRRGELFLEAELVWHDEFDGELAHEIGAARETATET